ncbi:hypothetical protein M406DRAFT_333677 [Cryphonectria parasitica EP155]|uniref:Uncharacterized protein n=1 Tax=Cryphonectria parasitica (strain ATCC 38755 / EP155) TaxID=660469 RepID=A0A9P5CLA2_CRYP1|nr:uncharacterized protein M406DRAFT_333677 [Cryphonectria parasitica EP155]KAF3761615.1 hypothetical protein M406DRAFT_333677 [Cryphonectria parasitica EP155]
MPQPRSSPRAIRTLEQRPNLMARPHRVTASWAVEKETTFEVMSFSRRLEDSGGHLRLHNNLMKHGHCTVGDRLARNILLACKQAGHCCRRIILQSPGASSLAIWSFVEVALASKARRYTYHLGPKSKSVQAVLSKAIQLTWLLPVPPTASQKVVAGSLSTFKMLLLTRANYFTKHHGQRTKSDTKF